MTHPDSFHSRRTFLYQGECCTFFDIHRVPGAACLPFAHKILLENLLRYEDGITVTRADIEALIAFSHGQDTAREIAYRPARVLMQDFTGVPAIVDLATLRDAVQQQGKDTDAIAPSIPVEIVIDHSVQVDDFGNDAALRQNINREYARNRERYEFLKWGQQAFKNFKVVPPGAGIVHQVNLETLARVVFWDKKENTINIFPDTVVGTDSHTTMINGLGVLGWGVGGIEAEAAMLGQPISMLAPPVVGVELFGTLSAGCTATDLVLVLTQMLRAHGVVGKFVEFHGNGLANLSLADRATIANMAPEYGATCGLFPVDSETLRYLKITNRSTEQIERVRTYYQHQHLFEQPRTTPVHYAENLQLDLSSVSPSLAGPKRPQDRIAVKHVKKSFEEALQLVRARPHTSTVVDNHNASYQLRDGAVVIAAITSCTNTSNPAVMLGAGLLARNALRRGLQVKPWVKTSLAPGSRVVTEYLQQADLLVYLEALKFYLVGYGCTTCIGNSGPLPQWVAQAIDAKDLQVAAVLSGNRNFEGRVHPQVKMNYLASPPLVVAYALAGRIDINLDDTPLGWDQAQEPVYLRDIWPSSESIQQAMEQGLNREQFARTYKNIFDGDAQWRELTAASGTQYAWQEESTYVRRAPFFDEASTARTVCNDIENARVLALLGDSITTDHISPAGSIAANSPAARYLQENGVKENDFNSYGSRRGNHEVMMRGTFANIRLRNQLAPGSEGGITRFQPDDIEMSIFDAAMRYHASKTPVIVIAGAEYGSGSSRDWAAKGPRLLGVQAIIAISYERIHRTNLVGMGILPLQFCAGQNATSLGLDGTERYTIEGIEDGGARQVKVRAIKANNQREIVFACQVRIDTPQEIAYFRSGGILHYVLQNC